MISPVTTPFQVRGTSVSKNLLWISHILQNSAGAQFFLCNSHIRAAAARSFRRTPCLGVRLESLGAIYANYRRR
jgi:hypothetical protein